MANDDEGRELGLYWIPLVLGVGSASFFISLIIARRGTIQGRELAALILGVAAGAAAAAAAVFASGAAVRLLQARKRLAELEKGLSDAHAVSVTLNSHLEVLTAMREVTRILSDTVDLKEIARNVFDVLEPLLGTEEIALILKGQGDELAVKALRRDGKTLYDDQLSGSEVSLEDAAEAFDRQRLVRKIEAAACSFCVPLVADQNTVGVMRFLIPVEGPAEERQRKAAEFEVTLADIAKHLALAVKTPALHDQAIIDGLTGLFTRRHFDIRLDDMFRLARRYTTPFSLILLDIDHFKRVNDTFGHREGDAVLREVAGVVTGAIRDCDSAFRYGGEEFAVLLPETPGGQAVHIAERLRKVVREHPVKGEREEISLTLSLGVAEYNPDLAHHGELIALADRALYKAKAGGRDAVVVSADVEPKRESPGGAG